MRCLVDNDIIQKLGECDLLNEAVAVLGTSRSQIYVLPTARFKLRKVTADPVRSRILDFLSAVNEIQSSGVAAEIEVLASVDGIDTGEAVLFASTATIEDDYVLLTGDKTSLKSLASARECAKVALRLKGKILCFEQVMTAIIDQFGFAYVIGKVIPAVGCDTALRAAFGSGVDSRENETRQALTSYVEELRALPMDLLR